jgi:hypoxanthine phosphoribosyltransferase
MNFLQNEIVPDNYELLFSEEQIRQRIMALGAEIARDFKEEKPILIGVLNGGFMFLSDLIRCINADLEIDFLRISSYGNARESSGHIKILKPLSADIRDRSVVVVEDIVDSGLSIQFLNNMLSAFQPKILKFATLLYKPKRAKVKIDLHYIGFEIEDQYVVGYGLDDAQIKRNLRGIYTVAQARA